MLVFLHAFCRSPAIRIYVERTIYLTDYNLNKPNPAFNWLHTSCIFLANAQDQWSLMDKNLCSKKSLVKEWLKCHSVFQFSSWHLVGFSFIVEQWKMVFIMWRSKIAFLYKLGFVTTMYPFVMSKISKRPSSSAAPANPGYYFQPENLRLALV